MIGGAAMFASIAKNSPIAAGRTGAPPFLVLMLKMTASSFMEMLIWMGPPGEKAVDVDVVHSQLVHGDVDLDGPTW